jgi:hypothetical protein
MEEEYICAFAFMSKPDFGVNNFQEYGFYISGRFCCCKERVSRFILRAGDNSIVMNGCVDFRLAA